MNNLNEFEATIEYTDEMDENISYTEMINDELNYNDNSEGEHDTQDDTFHQSKDDSILKLKAFCYAETIKEFRSGILNDNELESKMSQSINAANELVLNFGNIDALDSLLTILIESINIESNELIQQTTLALEEFILLEKCPLIEEDYSQESSTQITVELQNHLLNNLLEMNNNDTKSIILLINTFKENPNFASDTRL